MHHAAIRSFRTPSAAHALAATLALALAAPLPASALGLGCLFPGCWAVPHTAICPGDCNVDGAATIDELLTGVLIAQGAQSAIVCPGMDDSGDGLVTVDEIVDSVNYSLDGCPAARWLPGECDPALRPEGQAVERMQCGSLMARESRAVRNPRVVYLSTVVLRASGPAPQPDPFVFLTGGPGSHALDAVYLASLTDDFAGPIQAQRDIVIFDQRGTGTSRPALDCAEIAPPHLGYAELLTPAEEAERELDGARQCAARLTGDGVDLSAYHSAATAQDIADLMDALGYGRFNLYGLSYGTRVALTALRDLPAARIRSVVLDSAVPPQLHLVSGGAAAALEHSLERMFADCAASPACLAAYPDLETTTYALIERLNAEPLALDPTGPDGPFHVVLTGDRLLRVINFGLQSNSLIPFVPLLIDSTARGDTFLLSIALGGLAEPDPTSAGLAHAVLCNEETPFNDAAARAAAEVGVDPRLVPALTADPRGTFCPWDEPPVDPIENQPVHSDVPVLVLAGEYDSSTPPSWSQLAASTLSRSTYVEFRGFGHVVLGQDLTPSTTPCAMQVIADFIADPDQTPDRTCVDALPAPLFLAGNG